MASKVIEREMRTALKNATTDLRMHMNDHINECVIHVQYQVRQTSLSEVMRQRRDSPNRRVALTNDFTNSLLNVNEQLNEYIFQLQRQVSKVTQSRVMVWESTFSQTTRSSYE